MGGAPLLLALAVVTADVGWESDGADGYRYIIQVPEQQLVEIQQMGSVTSQIPVELQGRVTSVVIQVGDAELPRAEITPLATESPQEPAADPVPDAEDSADTDPELTVQIPAESAGGASRRQTSYPSPPDTVRAQGDSSDVTLPDLDAMRERTRRTAEELKNGVTQELENAATQAGQRARDAFQQQVNGAIDASANSLKNAASGALATGTDAARNAMSASAPSTNPAHTSTNPATTSSGAANSYGRSDFNGFQMPATGNNSGAPATNDASAYSPIAPSTSQGSTSPRNPTAGAGVSSPYTPREDTAASGQGAAGQAGAGQGGAGQVRTNPQATGAYPPHPDAHATANDPPSFSNTPFSGASGASGGATNTATSTNYPTAGGYGSPHPSATGAPSAQPPLTDEQLLSQIAFQDNYPYDKRTRQWLSPDDPRMPLVQDYVRRREEEQRRMSQPLAPVNGGSPHPYAADTRPTSGASTPPYPGSHSGLGWSNTYDDRYASTTPPRTEQTSRPAEDRETAGTQEPARRPSDRTSQAAAESPSDAPPPTTTNSGAREIRRVEPQPFFNALLLLSVVVNVYLAIAISRLLKRYRNLVATHRGSPA